MFGASDIERATDHFNESRVLGEVGFGRVYGGVLEDGTEDEMLGRLHHRESLSS